jgi:hypothetical protein
LKTTPSFIPNDSIEYWTSLTADQFNTIIQSAVKAQILSFTDPYTLITFLDSRVEQLVSNYIADRDQADIHSVNYDELIDDFCTERDSMVTFRRSIFIKHDFRYQASSELV